MFIDLKMSKLSDHRDYLEDFMNRTFTKINWHLVKDDWTLFQWVGSEGIELYLQYVVEKNPEIAYEKPHPLAIWNFRTWCLKFNPRIKNFM